MENFGMFCGPSHHLVKGFALFIGRRKVGVRCGYSPPLQAKLATRGTVEGEQV